MTLSYSRFSRSFVLIFVSVWALTATMTAVAAEAKHDFEVVDFTEVYYGSARHPKAPARASICATW